MTTWTAVTAASEGVEGTEAYAAVSSYTPQTEDVGYLLRATVRYRDGHGEGKQDSSTTSQAVVSATVPGCRGVCRWCRAISRWC